MNSYWKNFWDEYTANVNSDDLYKQVLRSKNKKPQSEESILEIIHYIQNHLKLHKELSLLDICCGNGLLTSQLLPYVKEIAGVDFCQNLINTAQKQQNPIEYFCEDAVNFHLPDRKFDRILMTAALQHFSEAQVVNLFVMHYNNLAQNGMFLITDILDIDQKWSFFQTNEQKKAHFDAVAIEKPLMGSWFKKEWLIELAYYSGFKNAKVLVQPDSFYFSHYRFDLLCEK